MRTIGSPSQGYLTYKSSSRKIDPLTREHTANPTPTSFSPWLKEFQAASSSTPTSASFERPRPRKHSELFAPGYQEYGLQPQVRSGVIGTTDSQGSPIQKYRGIKMPSHMSEYDFVPILKHSPRGRTTLARSSTTRDSASSQTGTGPTRARSLSPENSKGPRFGKPEEENEEYGITSIEPVKIPHKRSKSPSKQMFGEKGWLHRDGESMNQLTGQKLRPMLWNNWVSKVKQKADDTVGSFIGSNPFLILF